MLFLLFLFRIVKNISNNSNINNNYKVNSKDGKKRMVDTSKLNSNSSSEYLFYKYDDEYFLKSAEYCMIYKLPLLEKGLENIENKNEPIYKAIMIITAEKFYSVIKYLNENNNIEE